MPDGGQPWRPERIVVGVDIVGVNWPAVRWAVREARRTNAPMILVGSTVAYPPPPELPRGQTLQAERLTSPTWEVLDDVRARLVPELDDVRVLVVDGEPPRAIAACAGEHERTDMSVLEQAFSRAADLRAPLVAVSAWDLTTPYGVTAQELRERREAVELTLAMALNPVRARYPAVVVRTRCEPLTPTAALIAAAGRNARILVVGRHTGPHHVGGLSPTSTVRHLLRHAPCPVMVVPTGSRHPSGAEEVSLDDADVPEC